MIYFFVEVHPWHFLRFCDIVIHDEWEEQQKQYINATTYVVQQEHQQMPQQR